ncbi:hypothetical protein RYX51_22920 (plasmid) [Priestia filamentosa]|nr:hypothetical protein RYX51_22920 [Priestia filamentosa]
MNPETQFPVDLSTQENDERFLVGTGYGRPFGFGRPFGYAYGYGYGYPYGGYGRY